ncbi:MAG TPA: tetratricopeptide repeat protein, partial [Pyrinomonadaceae bacterium]|nr:tetratricopeptide repeat protein [Pyrinomonadaceae bacterium]
NKLRERFPRFIRDNKETLYKSVRRSQLKAIRDVCNAYRDEIKKTSSKKYNLDYIKKVEDYLKTEEANLTRGDFQDINLNEDEIRRIISNDKIPQNIQIETSSALIKEFPKHDTLPQRFVEMLEKGWVEKGINHSLFERFEAHFNAELAKPEVANVLFKKALSGIQISIDELLEGQANQTEEIKKLREIFEKRADELERLGYRILYKESGEIEGFELIGEKLDEISEGIKRIEAKLDGRIFTEPKITHNLPNTNTTIYGRDKEAEMLLEAFCGEKAEYQSRRFSLVVAPSGFGKSILLEKALKEVVENDQINPEYQSKVQRIMLIDCFLKQSLTDIVSEFNLLLGTQESFQKDFDAVDFANKLVQLPADRVWLILDNFEKWLDENYEITNAEVRAFLNALFSFGYIRGVILSQTPPVNSILQKVNQLNEIGDNLYAGLPPPDALQMLRTEGKSVGLDNVSESLLNEFLKKVAYIPQALNSLLGYMQGGITLEEVLHAPEFQTGFDEYESDEEKLKQGERRTKALIKRQIEAQSEEVKLLLQCLTYFEKPLPQDALELLFDDKVKARNAVNRLKTHRLATANIDIRQVIYCELHSYFRDQTKIVLPDFSRIANEDYAVKIGNKGNEADNLGYLQKAFDLHESAEKIFKDLHEQLIESAKDLPEQKKSQLIFSSENIIATAYLNKGNALWSLGRLNEAIDEYNKAIEIREKLVEAGRTELSSDLAMAYMNKGTALDSLGRSNEAINEYDKAIEIYEKLVAAGRTELSSNLAAAYMNKGVAFEGKNNSAEAVAIFGQAIELWEQELQLGFVHNLPNLVKAVRIRAASLIKLKDWENIAVDGISSLSLFVAFTQDENLSEHFKQQIGGEFFWLLKSIKQLSSENQEKIFTIANEIGQSQDEPEPFGDILRQYIEGIE